jgi:HK97 family phage portal protein
MGIIQSFWNSIFGKKTLTKGNNYSFNQSTSGLYGSNIAQSTLVAASLHAIADEASKMTLKSVMMTDSDNGIIFKKNNDDLNRLFDRRPNPLMTMKDLLYWSVYRLEAKSNFYWYPERQIETYLDGRRVVKTIAIYPINSIFESMIFDEKDNKHYIVFHMDSGNEFKFPYDEIIHVRKHFGTSDYYFGSKNRTELLETLGVMKDIKSLLPKAIKASMQIKGILTAKSQADLEGLKAFKEEFEQTLNSSDKALGVLDVAGTFTPVQIDPKVIDKDTLSYMDLQIISEFGVDLSIIQGNADENKWASFYQKCIEPIQDALEQAASSVLFTINEFNHGNRIKIYDRKVQHLSMSTRLNLIKELGPRGYLSRSEQRELAGYEPDGGKEQISLNYVDSENQNNYQKSNKGAEEDVNTKK